MEFGIIVNSLTKARSNIHEQNRTEQAKPDPALTARQNPLHILVPKIMAIFLALTFSAAALAADLTRAVTCNGCTDTQMSQAAVMATDTGTVYVFNLSSGAVSKYSVLTEFVDTTPFTVLKEAREVPVENEIGDSFRSVVSDLYTAQGDIIALPPGFPIRSSAGALLDPNFAIGHIRNHISGLGFWRSLQIELRTVLSALLTRNVPLLDASSVFSSFRITIKFPDGSTMKYDVSYAIDVLTGDASMVLDPIEATATTPDGNPVPTSPPNFNGMTFTDNNGSLADWIRWARSNGVPVVAAGGSSRQYRMVCEVSGDEVHCEVIYRP